MKFNLISLHLIALAGTLTGQNSSCEKLLIQDVTQRDTDLSTVYSTLKVIDQETYEKSKTNASGTYKAVFGASYEDFKERRNRLFSLFSQHETSDLNEKYLQRSLSTSTAKAYAECVALNNRSMLSAWIDKETDRQIAIVVRNGQPGHSEIDYKVFSDDEDLKPINSPIKLLSGGTQTLIFRRDSTKDLMIILEATEKSTGAQSSIALELPRKRKFRIVSETVELTGTIECGAGGYGSPQNNQHARNAELTAPPGFYIVPDSQKPGAETVLGGPGVASYQVEWEKKTDSSGITKLIGKPVNVVGNSKHTQGIIRVPYTAVAKKENVVED